MNKEDIIRMAREAGLHREQHNLMSNPMQHRVSYGGYEENLERFATLVAEHEREEIAQFIESTVLGSLPYETAMHYAKLLKTYSTAIRARGDKHD